MLDKLPEDPVLLLSVVNTKLRDHYSHLDFLCQDLNIEKEQLVKKFALIDYVYDEGQNQFI